MFWGLVVDKKTPHILLLQKEMLLFTIMSTIVIMIIERKVLLFTMMLFITDCGIKRGAGAGGGGHEAESSSNLEIRVGSFFVVCFVFFSF